MIVLNGLAWFVGVILIAMPLWLPIILLWGSEKKGWFKNELRFIENHPEIVIGVMLHKSKGL